MNLEGITIDENCQERFNQLPNTFINLNAAKINVFENNSENEKRIEISVEQRERDIPIEINLPTLAKDIKITSYEGSTFTEFYYKKTNYLVRY